MKNLLLIFTLLFTSVFFSSPSYAEWEKVSEGENGNTYYIDFERTRKHGGFVYYWTLGDYLKPDEYEHLSSKIYNQGDCKLFRLKFLSFVHHKQPMGRDTGDSNSPKDPKWTYPSPNSIMETLLKSVCSR